MSSLVRSLGYQSRVFRSAEAFLTSPELNDSSCVITDVHMSGMSGVELQDALSKRRPHMPVILITAFPEERIRKRAEAGGAVAFFSKPVDNHALIECLKAALERADGTNLGMSPRAGKYKFGIECDLSTAWRHDGPTIPADALIELGFRRFSPSSSHVCSASS